MLTGCRLTLSTSSTRLSPRTRHRAASVVGITGGIAAGKSTVAAAVAAALGWPNVSTDGFIRADAGNRKGYADSYDAAALRRSSTPSANDGKATVPRYSHLHYDVVGYDEIGHGRS